MKAIAILCIATMIIAPAPYSVSIFEWNFLYQFGDLDTDQFNYVEQELLRYPLRMENNFRVLNSVFSQAKTNNPIPDVACLVEWNGSEKSRYFVPTRDQFQKVKEVRDFLLADKEFQEMVSKRDNYLKNRSNLTALKNYKKAEENFLNSQEKENKEFEDALNTFNDHKSAILKNFIDDYNYKNDSFDRENIKDAIQEIREMYGDNLFPFSLDAFEFTEFIPEAKASKEKFGNGFDMKGSDNKRWYMFDSFWKLFGDFALFKADNYEWRVTEKSTGVAYKDGEKNTSIKFKDETPQQKEKRKSKPNQSLLFLHNKQKFECSESLTIALAKDDKNLEAQNIGVTSCYHIDNSGTNYSQKLVFIYTHFKSKSDGYDNRMRMGNEIRNYIKINHKEDNVVLMGDLNAEIGEIATALGGEIRRLDTTLNQYSYRRYFQDIEGDKNKNEASKEQKAIVSKIRELEEKMKETKANFAKLNPYVKGNSNDYSNARRAQLAMELQYLEEELDLQKDLFSKILPKGRDVTKENTWYETYYQKTESKIRIKEIDYFKAQYLQFLQTVNDIDNKEIKKCFNGLFPKMHKINEEGMKNELEIDKDNEKNIQKQNKIAFINTVVCLQEEIEEMSRAKMEGLEHLDLKKSHFYHDLVHGGWVRKGIYHHKNIFADVDAAQKILDSFLGTLIDTEKIDYILLRFLSDFEIIGVHKIDDYDRYLEVGMPNETFSSDHLPTHVTIKVMDRQKQAFSI
jgi:hypothetical protein